MIGFLVYDNNLKIEVDFWRLLILMKQNRLKNLYEYEFT